MLFTQMEKYQNGWLSTFGLFRDKKYLGFIAKNIFPAIRLRSIFNKTRFIKIQGAKQEFYCHTK
jgi:hypothetical protein